MSSKRSSTAALMPVDSNTLVIDLTMDDEASPSPSSLVDLTQDHLEATEEETELHLLATISLENTKKCAIVGIRYYRGVAHPGEYVQLVREPTNPYDRNAIQVNNQAGQKVGHINKELAAQLSPIMRDHPECIFDATIPSYGCTFTLPISIEIRGPDAGLALSIEQALGPIRQANQKKRLQKQAAATTKVVVHSRTLNWEDQQKELDEVFTKQAEQQLLNLPEIDFDKLPLHTTLLPHQKQGVRWLYAQEQGTNPIPFWKETTEQGKTVWLSELTQSSQPQPPPPVKGALLCDDMGLGKTIQAIAAILANPPPGRNYTTGKYQTGNIPTTLVVCPVSVLGNWQHQIEHHVEADTLRVELYHGSNRKKVLQELDKIDVLLVSYHTLAYDFSRAPAIKRQKSNSIFSANFHRLILDEGHIIRNSSSKLYQAATNVNTTHRICLTGTPLTNKPEDIFSLLSFLKLEPLTDKNVYRRAIAQPIKDGDDMGLTRMRVLMAHVALRRSKAMVDIRLPEKVVELRTVSFADGCRHRGVYDTIFRSAKFAFQAVLTSGKDSDLSHQSVFEVLTRLRQACCSGDLVPKERLEAAEQVLALVESKGQQLTAEEGKKLLEKLKGFLESNDPEATDCAVCFDAIQKDAAVVLRTCSHIFCEECMNTIATQHHASCPLCRVSFTRSDMVKYSEASAVLDDSSDDVAEKKLSELEDLGPSPKAQAIVQALEEMQHDEKAVIFSQFTKFLDKLQVFLSEKGYAYARIDGSMSATKRIEAMRDFNSIEGGPAIMLCSLHAAGTGINLTRANHVLMADTWWNSAVEHQAQDRVHRIGQFRKVRVLRFVAEDSVEAKMIALQEAKAAMGKGAFEKLNSEEKRKARMDDVKRLLELD